MNNHESVLPYPLTYITYFKVLERWLDLFFVFSKKQKYDTDYA